ncbi:MAG: zinc ribbon domain-containing protein [Armatimonadetes bacterium]|nr:zinc ribbon domain-containing protein [Armatimonadota bacterium]
MPFYEYKCGGCGEVFTLLQKRDAKREGYACPDCGASETRRVMSTFASHGDARGKSECSEAASCPAVGSHCCGPGCCH